MRKIELPDNVHISGGVNVNVRSGFRWAGPTHTNTKGIPWHIVQGVKLDFFGCPTALMNYNIVIGDWSDDGHGKTCHNRVETHSTYKEVEAAYKRGSKKVGFDLVKEVCHEYEDNIIPFVYIELLNEAGINILTLLSENEEDARCETGFLLDTESYFKLWLAIVNLGNPPDPIKDVTKESKEFRIGGYGLLT